MSRRFVVAFFVLLAACSSSKPSSTTTTVAATVAASRPTAAQTTAVQNTLATVPSSASSAPAATTGTTQPATTTKVTQPATTTPTVPTTQATVATTALANLCGAPANPFGYNLCGRGSTITSPDSATCSYFTCIGNFSSGSGFMIQCADNTYSMSGGKSGVARRTAAPGRRFTAGRSCRVELRDGSRQRWK